MFAHRIILTNLVSGDAGVLVCMGARVLCIVCGVWRVFIVGGVCVCVLSGVFSLCLRVCVQVVLVCASGVFVCACV